MNAQSTAGVCEDDDELRGIVRAALEREGHQVRATASGAEAVNAFAARPPDVIVLDIGLPDADGRDVCQALRSRGVDCPVLFLTARDALSDRLSGFRAGADDYLVKPFALSELIVRIEALLRRSPPRDSAPSPTALPVPPAGLMLDPAGHALVGPGGRVALTPTEFRLLGSLLAQRGTIVRRASLCRSGWVDGSIVNSNTLDAYISRLRRKLREATVNASIANARGVGYVLR